MTIIQSIKIGQKQKIVMWIHETPILDYYYFFYFLFFTLAEKSSVVTYYTQGPQKYLHHQKKL